MVISLNEHADAEKYLSDFTIGKDIFNRLKVIARFYLDSGYNESQVNQKLRDYISQCGDNPSLNYWTNMTENAIKKAKKSPAVLIDYIYISSSEINTITKLESTQLRRLAFTLLCLAKYRDITVENNDHWVSFEDKDIMRLANIKTSLKRQAMLFSRLEESGYLSFPNKVDSISMKVEFIDNKDNELEVTNYKDLGYQLLKYLGEPYFECCNCGAVVKLKPVANRRKPPKYCDECAARIKTKRSIESVMRLRDINAQVSHNIG